MAATYLEAHNGIGAADRQQVNRQERVSEAFWFSLCLFLFLILGPFAAPIVLCFMFSSSTILAEEMREPETLQE